ncbi:MAG TPA: DUF1788 domain-containing protein [Pyrinomonadaceae bacterium]|nr:DUF1788 domain-containing protein [Pyrinomonadaceae bacterium]
MKDNFYERLNKIKNRLDSHELHSNVGLGNEIGFYIFDYPPEQELVVRNHLEKILPEIPRKISVVNLFELVVEYFKKRKILEPAKDAQVKKGDAEVLRLVKGSLDEEKRISPEFIAAARPEAHDLVIMTGIGNVYPLLRTHRLINCLHPLMQDTPLVVFYPGKYSGQTLSLFGELKDENYYRAFRLVA